MKIYVRADIIDPMDESKEAQLELIRSGRMRPETFLRFAKSKYADVRAAVAESLNTPVSVLDRLAKDRTITVRQEVASNPHASREALLRLLQDSNRGIYYIVSRNEKFIDTLSAEELDALYHAAPDDYIRNRDLMALVAAHPNTSAKTLVDLATTGDSRVAGIAIRNPNIPAEALAELSELRQNVDPSSGRMRIDDNWSKLRALAENPNTSPEILTKLGLGDYEYAIHAAVADNKNTPPEVLAKLSNDDQGASVRGNVARNPNTPVDILEKLADDKDYLVRSDVAHNENAPVELLKYLATDSDGHVRNSVASNPNTPEDVLRSLATDTEGTVLMNLARNSNLPADLIETLSRNSNSYVRAYIASNPATPPEILRVLARDSDPYADVKAKVAENPNTPLDVLESLIHDNQYDHVVKNPNATHEMLVEAYDVAQKYEKKAMSYNIFRHPNFKGSL